MTTVLIIMIVVGLGLAAAGLVVAARAGWRLYKTGRRVQQVLEVEIQALVTRQEQALERVSLIEQDQAALAESMERMKQATSRLGYLLGQASEARERITRVP